MTVKIKRRRGHIDVRLGGDFTIYNVTEIKQALLEALRGNEKTIEAELSEVSELDTAGLQVLLLFKREAAKAGKIVRLNGHSPATSAVFGIYNLHAYFDSETPRARRGEREGDV